MTHSIENPHPEETPEELLAQLTKEEKYITRAADSQRIQEFFDSHPAERLKVTGI